jgi:hypothetical protein
MPYDLEPLERPQHLVAYVSGRDDPFVDARIRQVNRKALTWHCLTSDLWTPLSLPLRIEITLGLKNGLQVWSESTRLLDVRAADVGIDVSLLLPTDEVLWVRVEERRYGSRDVD